ncbi:DUF3472 domain-containing protein [Nocardia arthritidis]|uniref:DUF3472 domain-containing protein n=1 Tax=Nocardia arthritidis TaxID=228602 RepID=A0A6G9YLE8_9NOCA|nr:DUF3472 domain-containing protein [Nocardia arthritidis]QIS13970.1 DUF3472 domain-containing protein [Nocardia arthritidis]
MSTAVKKLLRTILISVAFAIGIIKPSVAQAIVAGGMAAIDRTWPEVPGGFDDMTFSITVTREPGSNGKTYWAHQWGYTGTTDGGYIGLQSRDGNDKALNFSIWGATSWRDSAGATCNLFGHEGSGVQCWINYAWQQGVTYQITLAKSGTDGWTASITNTRTRENSTVATIVVPPSYGGLAGLSEWVENFAQGAQQPPSCSAVPAATAVYGTPTANGGKVTPTSSNSYTYGNCAWIAKTSCTTEQVCTLSVNPDQPPRRLTPRK